MPPSHISRLDIFVSTATLFFPSNSSFRLVTLLISSRYRFDSTTLPTLKPSQAVLDTIATKQYRHNSPQPLDNDA